jgi:translin
MVMSLHDIFNSFQDELSDKVKKNEAIKTIARKIIYLSKHSIMATHRDALTEAQEKVKKMEDMRMQLDSLVKSNPDLMSNIVQVAYQEYSEARVLLSLVESGHFPHPQALQVTSVSYVLGLADAIGELRRRALNCLLASRLADAEKWLSYMEDMFKELIALEDAYVLAPELRRKCDIARRIIESTLGDILTESRRQKLESAINRLETKLNYQSD